MVVFAVLCLGRRERLYICTCFTRTHACGRVMAIASLAHFACYDDVADCVRATNMRMLPFVFW